MHSKESVDKSMSSGMENEIKKLLSVNAKYLILEINHNHIKETIDILDKIKKGV